MPRYWKVLDARGHSCHGGTLQWSLPTWDGYRWTPGEWMPRIDDITLCERGYHACRNRDLIAWPHDRIWRLEVADGAQTVTDTDKIVTTGPVRLIAGTAWNNSTARLFAVSCALDVLPFYENAHPEDTRVSDALVTAWEYARGFASERELDAARAAAWAAAWAAARAAAGAAAWAAARAAAWAAAGDAAWAAARDAAGDAARAAARDAAGDAAWAAAWAAAGDAAGDAAWAAAWAAACDAARDAQTRRLLRYLRGEVDV